MNGFITWLKRLFGFIEPLRVLRGDGTWSFTAYVDGDDIVVRNARTTWFGGPNDSEDSGATASGLNTRRHPDIKGCALPMSFGPCDGSPLPRLPWGTLVEIMHPASGKTLTVPVVDLGPSKRTGNALDLTEAAFRVFASSGLGRIVTHYRIKDGAKHLPG